MSTTDPPIRFTDPDIPSDIARATDPPNVPTDPFAPWLDQAARAHDTMTRANGEMLDTAKWRRECVTMAVALGATHQQVADRLGISRVQVTTMMRERKNG